MFDHEYTLVAHPRLRARISYRRGDGGLSAVTVRLDYRRDEEWTEEGPAVDVPEHPEEAGVEMQGLQVALYRDGDRLVARELSSGVVSDALGAVDAVERHAPSVVEQGKQVVERVASRSDRLEMTQRDGSIVEALAPPAQATFEVYEAKDGKWRWRLLHDNGNVIADSGQGYSSKQAAKKGIRSVKRNALGAGVETVGGESERDVRASSDAETEIDVEPASDTEREESDVETGSDTGTGTDAETEPDTESGTDVETDNEGSETGSAES